jgi:hypothetical protein
MEPALTARSLTVLAMRADRSPRVDKDDRRGAKSATQSRVAEARAKEIELRTAREEGRRSRWKASAQPLRIFSVRQPTLGGAAEDSTASAVRKDGNLGRPHPR